MDSVWHLIVFGPSLHGHSKDAENKEKWPTLEVRTYKIRDLKEVGELYNKTHFWVLKEK